MLKILGFAIVAALLVAPITVRAEVNEEGIENFFAAVERDASEGGAALGPAGAIIGGAGGVVKGVVRCSASRKLLIIQNRFLSTVQFIALTVTVATIPLSGRN